MKKTHSSKSTLIQVVVTLVANTAMYLNGMVCGFPSAVLGPLVKLGGSSFHASVEVGTWIASVAYITLTLGCLLGGPLIDNLGRRRGFQLLSVFSILGWTLLAIVPILIQSITLMVVGRAFTGLGAGLAVCVTATYVAEIASNHMRTILLTLGPVLMGGGIFTIYLMAYLFQEQWTYAASFCTAVSVVCAILFSFLPESPLWLLSKNDEERALQSLMFLRGEPSSQQVAEEFEQITLNASSRNSRTSWRITLQKIYSPEVYKPLIIMNIFLLFQQLTGVSAIIAYGVEFAKDAGIEQDAYTVALLIGVIRVMSAFITSWACNRWGRRKPAIVAGSGMILSLLGTTAYLFVRKNYPDSFQETMVFPATCILIYTLTSAIGFSNIPWSMVGEMFPTSVRGILSGFTCCMAYLESFVVVKYYPIMEDLVGNTAVMFFFGLSSLVGTIYLFIFLPETHRKSLQDIEEYFKGGNKTKQAAANDG